MTATQEWLNEQLCLFEHNPVQTLADMLFSTNRVIEKYINDKNSKLTEEVLVSCMEHNKLFFEELNKQIL